MLPAFRNVGGSDIDYGAPDGLRGQDDDIVIFSHLEVVKGLAWSRLVQNTVVNRLRHGVVDKLRENETVPALIEELHGVGRNRKPVADVGISLENLKNR